MSLTQRCYFVAAALLIALPAFAAKPDCVNTTRDADPITHKQYIYRVCQPDPAVDNGGLVVYAHGYVDPTDDNPIPIPEDQLMLGGVSVPDLVTNLGFTFATSSFPKTGLAIKEGVEDMKNLVDFYKLSHTPNVVYIVGVSEGGLVATKDIEKYGGAEFNGGLALCGPIGDFRSQLDYFDDFRTVFDYFYPGKLQGTTIDVPPAQVANWENPAYLAMLSSQVAADPNALSQLLSVTKVPVDPSNPGDAIFGLLDYNILGTADANSELGGQPYDNRLRWYSGSTNDFRMNLRIDRYRADSSALAEIRNNYQTTGKLPVPLVTMHTTGDPIVPYWQESRYGLKVLFSRSLRNYFQIPILRYGHCNFKPAEALAGFAVLVAKVKGQQTPSPESVLKTDTAQ